MPDRAVRNVPPLHSAITDLHNRFKPQAEGATAPPVPDKLDKLRARLKKLNRNCDKYVAHLIAAQATAVQKVRLETDTAQVDPIFLSYL